MNTSQTIGNFVTPTNVRNAREALVERGCLLIPGACGAEVCGDIMRWMDSCASEKEVEVHYNGTELRIWNTEKRNEAIRSFWAQSNEFMSQLLNQPTEAYTTLAIRNRPANLSDPTVTLGRWHIDSFRRQYKTFLFLSDVNESSGPFEYVPGTNSTLFKAGQVLRGLYFGLRDVFSGGKRKYARLDDAAVAGIAQRGYQPTPVLCPAGTVMIVDTSSIHRARPSVSLPRYALTTYYR